MLYAISETVNKSWNVQRYILFETSTESFFMCSKEHIQEIDSKINIVNIGQIEDRTKSKQWFNGIHHSERDNDNGSDYIVLCKIGEDKYKIISHEEKIIIVKSKKLIEYAKQHKVANCKVTEEGYDLIGTFNIEKIEGFDKIIAQKYERHVAMTALLGKPMSFQYIIEGQEVKLKMYTGKSKDIIIPNFITSIMARAFIGQDIEVLALNNGLKYIGSDALADCSIQELSIPETIKFIGHNAFIGSNRLVDGKGYYTGRAKILNKNALVVTYLINS